MESPAYLRRADGINPYEEVITNCLDYYTSPNMDVSIQNHYITNVAPNHPIVESSSEISFSLGSSTDYTNLNRTNIYVELHLVDEDGNPIPQFTAEESVGLENFVASSIFSVHV